MIKNFYAFSNAQREAILQRDNFQCVFCGLGKRNGLALQVVHIIPKGLGGKAEISNGQTLCAQHNFKKKNYKQTETGKKMFIRLYELAKEKGDKETQEFCAQILGVFEKNNVNGHIVWKK
jgi:5-methylcytosine-specific restriction endonuclease McrA